jgi:putative transposase
MSSSRKDFSQGYKIVKEDFQHSVSNLFEKQYHGSKCNNPIFINVLFCALCRIQSIFAAILKTLPEYQRLQKLVNQTIAEQLPKNLFQKSKRLAIDLVLIPYHGKHCYNVNEIDRSQSKSGTSHFHACATVYLLYKGFRYTVARLLEQCKSIGLKCKLLLLDRGFYSVSVISYLKHAQVPFVMPVICRGKKETKDQPAGGTRKYRNWKKSGFDKYELKTKAKGKETKTWFYVCICCKNQNGKRGRKSYSFAYYGVQSDRGRIESDSVLRRVIGSRTNVGFARVHGSRSCDFCILRCRC